MGGLESEPEGSVFFRRCWSADLGADAEAMLSDVGGLGGHLLVGLRDGGLAGVDDVEGGANVDFVAGACVHVHGVLRSREWVCGSIDSEKSVRDAPMHWSPSPFGVGVIGLMWQGHRLI